MFSEDEMLDEEGEDWLTNEQLWNIYGGIRSDPSN